MAEYYVATTGSDSTGDGSEGNPWATPGYAQSQIASGDSVGIQPGTYTTTTNTSNVAGGVVLINSSTWVGYWYGVSDPPVLRAGVNHSSGFLFVNNAQFVSFRNLIVDGNGFTHAHGVLTGANIPVEVDNCGFLRCTTAGVSAGGAVQSVSNCWADDCVTGFSNGVIRNSLALDCDTGFGNTGNANYPRDYCVASKCGIGFVNASTTNLDGVANIAYDCDSHGFSFGITTNVRRMNLHRCLAINNGGYGYHINPSDTGSTRHRLTDCVDFGNTSGRKLGGFLPDIRGITLTANPFTDPDNGDFSLNTTAGGGAVLRAANFAFPENDTPVYPFNGWAAPAGGGGTGPRRPRQGNLLGRSF
jgi:hypothetical protein